MLRCDHTSKISATHAQFNKINLHNKQCVVFVFFFYKITRANIRHQNAYAAAVIELLKSNQFRNSNLMKGLQSFNTKQYRKKYLKEVNTKKNGPNQNIIATGAASSV